MNKESAEYIWYSMTKEVYNQGLTDWCDDWEIKVSDFRKFEELVTDYINDMVD